MPTFVNKYELYQQVLKLEFIREFHALVEAANGRGEFKADFTDKILALVGNIIEPAVDAVNIALPVVPTILKKGGEFIIDTQNEARKEQKTEYFLQKGFDYNPHSLTVLAEAMSLTALKRYQWFVSQLDQDSVIRFAKAGIERMLEYLARMQLPLSIEHLLDGLLKGHSGAYISGYFNTQLTPIDCLAERIPIFNKIKEALGFTRVTAEGIYGRSGLLTCDVDSLELHVHALLDKNKAKHKVIVDKQEHSCFEKVKDTLSKEGRERWFDYGYTKTHSKYKEEPKYGYALFSPAEVSHYYGDKKNITTKRITDLESRLKDSLASFSYEIIPFNKTQIKNYLSEKQKESNLTLLAYLKERLNAKEARLAYFDGDDRDLRDLDLSGAHLDECVFDASIFPADLTNTTLRNSFLRYADFRWVEKAQGLDLSGGHAEYLEAAGANLSHAILRSSNLLGANLAKANLTGADILGANLIESNLKETICLIFNFQDIQAKQEQLFVQQQRLEEQQKTQSVEIVALRKTVSELQANNHIDIAEKLDQFLQERAARESLERYCYSEVERFTIQAQQQVELSQRQAEYLDVVKKDLADLQNLHVASQEDIKKLLILFEKLTIKVDAQGSQLAEVSQLLDQLISSVQNHLNQHEHRLRRHSEEIQAIRRNLEERKPEPLAPLSALRLQQIKQELYTQYKKTAVMFEFVPNQHTPMILPITEMTFVHLALITQEKQQQKERDIREELKQTEEEARQQLLNSWEMLSQVQEPISINDLWVSHKHDQNIPQHLLIEGSAGIGKTTLCGFVAVQWSQQKLWTEQFAWVLWISLRNLIDLSRYPRLTYDYSAKSFVLGECFGSSSNDRRPRLTIDEQDRLWQQLEEQSERVLYVLDGYDEIAGYEKRPELDHVKAAISQLLQSKHILLTTRPQVMNAQLLKGHKTRRLVTLGLSDDNVPLYIEHYFKAISKPPQVKRDVAVEEKIYDSPSLLEGLKANQTLWSVSHVPLHLSLICLAYAEGKLQASDLKQNYSLTQLYQQIVNVLLQRYLREKLKGTAEIEAERITTATIELEPHAQKVSQFLEEFAFRGMAQYDLILDDKLLSESLKATQQKLAIIPDLIASGLLKEVNDQGKPAYQFVHLTFQEFFAARYLAQRFQQSDKLAIDWIERFHEYKHIPRFAVMMWFTAGLLREKPLHLKQFIQLLQTPPRDEIGLYHLGLLMRCVAEGGYPKELTSQLSHHLGQLVDKCWLMVKEGEISTDGNKEIRAQSAQQVLLWLGEQRLLTPKIEFPLSNLNSILKESLFSRKENWTVRRLAIEILAALNSPTPQIIEGLVVLLKDENYNIRRAAAYALGILKPSIPQVVQSLVILLNDEYSCVIQAAACTLGKLQMPTPQVLQGIAGLLRSNSDIREAAVRVSGELKTPTPEILHGLLSLLDTMHLYSCDGGVLEIVRAVIYTLGELKKTSSEVLQNLVALLHDKDIHVRQAAAYALGALRTPTPEILQGLVALLKDPSEHSRQIAAEALAELRAQAPEVLQELQGSVVVLLKDADKYTRKTAAKVLTGLGTPTPEILQGLVALLHDEDSEVRCSAVSVLSALKTPTSEVVDALVSLLKNADGYLRQVAAQVLAELLGRAPEILEGIILALLKDENKYVRQAAAKALAELGKPDPVALQGLVALLYDEDGEVKCTAVNVFRALKMPTPEVVEGLVLLLKDASGAVRQIAAEVLAELRAQAPEVLQGLVVDLLKNENKYVRQAAVKSLAESVKPEPVVLQSLVASLHDEDYEVKLTAVNVLRALQTPTYEIIKDLVVLLKDESPSIRQAAAQVLAEMRTLTPEVFQGLVSLLKDKDKYVRLAAIEALLELQAPIQEVLKSLVALLHDEDYEVKLTAVRSLAQLKKPTSEVFQILVALLKDENRYVRAVAVSALKELKTPTSKVIEDLVALLKDLRKYTRENSAQVLNNFSTASLLNSYFSQNFQRHQSNIQESLLFFICKRWLINRQMFKITNQKIYWLEQGLWQHLPIPRNHSYLQNYIATTIEDCIGSPLSLTFPELSAAENITLFSSRSSFSLRPTSIAEPKDPLPK